MATAVLSQAATSEVRGVGQRAGALVAISGPYPNRVAQRVDRIPPARLALAGTISAFNVALTTQPYAAVERAVDSAVGAPTADAGPSEARLRALLLGTLATVATGLVVQRALNHAHVEGHAADLGRAVGSQLAIGGAASALVLATDIAQGPPEPSPEGDPGHHLAVTALVTLAQRRVLRRIAGIVTLPPPPRSVTVPVKNGWRVREKTLHLMR